ncbi:MAG: hypothetical protein ACK56I_24340, partial [bacterium]
RRPCSSAPRHLGLNTQVDDLERHDRVGHDQQEEGDDRHLVVGHLRRGQPACGNREGLGHHLQQPVEEVRVPLGTGEHKEQPLPCQGEQGYVQNQLNGLEVDQHVASGRTVDATAYWPLTIGRTRPGSGRVLSRGWGKPGQG